MSHPNEDLVRAGFAAYSRGDMRAMLTEFFAPDVIWHFPGRGPLAGDHAGLEAVGTYFGRLAELSEGTHRIELRDVIANDEHVVALHGTRAERAGRQLDIDAVQVFRIRDGKVAEAWTVHHDLYAFDDFWS